jgi:MFS family permease
MSPLEVRASISLASLFALRMLGLFLILPVFAVHAEHLPGGQNHTLVGLALGIYGLTQGVLQLPFGAASDRLGRKRVIIFGLLVFAAGSFIAAAARDIQWIIVGRGVQGAGAISAAVMALLADLTTDEHRTKAMAIVGASIGGMFALSMMAGPLLYRLIGMPGMFLLMGALSLAGVLVTRYVVPHADPHTAHHADAAHAVHHEVAQVSASGTGGSDLRRSGMFETELLRLHYGIFALQTVQVALFVVVPGALAGAAGLPLADHWKVYLPVVLLSFAFMLPPMRAAERSGHMKAVFIGAIGVMLAAQLALYWSLASLWGIAVSLLVYFSAFNLLAALLPSLISRMAPARGRGRAIGVYNTMQSLGSFVGGAAGGWMMQHYGGNAVFVLGGVLIAGWLVIALPMRPPQRRAAGQGVPAQSLGEPGRGVGV